MIHEFDPIIYPRKLWVVVNPCMKELRDVFEDISELAENTEAQVENVYNKIEKRGGVIIVFGNRKYMTQGTITHEAIHVAFSIMEYIDYKLDYNNQEPLTYLAGWVANCIDKVKKNKLKK